MPCSCVAGAVRSTRPGLFHFIFPGGRCPWTLAVLKSQLRKVGSESFQLAHSNTENESHSWDLNRGSLLSSCLEWHYPSVAGVSGFGHEMIVDTCLCCQPYRGV